MIRAIMELQDEAAIAAEQQDAADLAEEVTPAREAEADEEAEDLATVAAPPAHAVEGAQATNADPLADGRARDDGGTENDRRPKSMKGTHHRKATLGLGTQVGPDGAETGAPTAERGARTREKARYTIVAGKGAKLELAAGVVPTEDQLATKVEAGGEAIHHRRGTVDAPTTKPTMIPNNLFIDGGPKAPDIRQGGIGDCYFESCLLGVTNNDPAKINSIMSMSGGQVSVTLQRLDPATAAYVPKTIKTSATVMTRKDKDGDVSLVGAGMRIAELPKTTFWWAEVRDGVLEIHRRDDYEVALWAPMMEKCYAEFTERYGQYGGDAKGPKGSGYDALDEGGAVEDCYQMFYGGAASTNTRDMTFTPGADVVSGNWRAIRDLLVYEQTRGNTAGGQTQNFMHARMGADGAAQRGAALIDQVTPLLDAEQFFEDLGAAFEVDETIEAAMARFFATLDRQALRSALQTLKGVITASQATPATATEDDIATAAAAVQTPDLHPALWDDTKLKPFVHLRENLGILINLGSDSSPGGRFTYTTHAYSVKSVGLKDAGGTPLALTTADLPARAGEIDAEKSVVMMQNPHAANEPDLRGTGPADGKNDGEFAMTLDQFLRSFDLLRMATVAH